MKQADVKALEGMVISVNAKDVVKREEDQKVVLVLSFKNLLLNIQIFIILFLVKYIFILKHLTRS